MKTIKKNIILISFLAVLSLNSFAGTVTPGASFGTATHVVVAQNGTTSLVMAKNAKGDVFVGKAQYVAGQGTYYAKHEAYSHVRSGVNGAVSNGTVKATITQQVQKRSVIDEMLKKAKVGGKMLGKGAATVGRFAASNNPYIRAFSLVMLALEASNSSVKWDEEKNEFMRLNDDDTFVVFITNDYSAFNTSYTYTREQLDNFCKSLGSQSVNYVRTCFSFSYVKHEQIQEEMLAKCRMLDSRSNFIHEDGRCGGGRSSIYTEDGVKYARFASSVPISLDDFYRLVEKEVDKNPADWVKESGVEPSDLKVEVPVGTILQSNTYTDPKDGKVKQTRWDFEQNGRVRETVIPRPDLIPDSPEAPRLDPPSEEDTPNGDKDKDKDGENEKDKEKAETEDLCEKNPDIMACDKQPEKPDEQDFEIENETVNLFFAPDTIFPTTGTCPAPVSFRVDIPFAGAKTFEFDTAPSCEIARRLRDLLIAIAWLVTAVFCFRSFSLKG